jgi:hypothetical protein
VDQAKAVAEGADRATLAAGQAVIPGDPRAAAGRITRLVGNNRDLWSWAANTWSPTQGRWFQGDIKLPNGWVLPKNYGHLTHGYYVTSYGSQSKGVDCVFIAESSESFRATDREQFYVSVSRFKERLTIYTDDKRALLEAASKSSRRLSATDLVAGNFRATRLLRPTRFTPAQHRVQALEQIRQLSDENTKTEALCQKFVVESTAQPQRRSRGMSP